MDNECRKNDELTHIIEQAYLIDRGTRPMTLLPQRTYDECSAEEMTDRLSALSTSYPGAIPFVIRDSQSNVTQCGFATHRWGIDLFGWAQTAPRPYQDWIMGLLFGYSPAAIDDCFHRRAVTRLNSQSVELGSKSQNDAADKEESAPLY